MSRQTSKLSLITWDGSDTWLDNKRYGRRLGDDAESRVYIVISFGKDVGADRKCILGNKLKRTISAPFNFQHVAHSQRKQFANLEQTSQNELIAEYWAVRAAQRPRPDLRGIRAADLYSGTVSPEISKPSASFHETPPLELIFPPLLSTTSPQEVVVRSEGNCQSGHPKPRSAASFSQPIARTASQKMACSPAPRTSSAEALKDGGLSVSAPQDPYPNQGYMLSAITGSVTPTRLDRRLSSRKPLRTFNMAITLNKSAIAQAITTADETARQLRTPLSPAYSTDLQDVPEEHEGYFVERNQTDTPSHGARSGLAGSQPSPPAVQLPMQLDARMSPPATPREKKSRPMSQTSDTLGTPFTPLSRRLSLPIYPQEPSATPRGFDTSWYDDIDYCYENAAEASCDFQWGTTAKETDMRSECDLIIQSNKTTPASSMTHNKKADEPSAAAVNTELHQHKPDSLPDPQALAPSPCHEAIPDLESPSMRSWPSNGHGVATPPDTPTHPSSNIRGDNTAPFQKSNDFTGDPSSLTPGAVKNQLGNEPLEEAPGMDGLDRHDLMSKGYSDFFRRRRSGSMVGSVPSPNRLGSEEHFLKSRALGSVRGSPAAGDLPRRDGSRRGPLNFDQVVDSLSQDIESLVRLEEPLSWEGLSQLAPTVGKSPKPIGCRSDMGADQHGRSSSPPSAEAAPSTAIPLTPPPKSRARSATYLAGAVPR